MACMTVILWEANHRGLNLTDLEEILKAAEDSVINGPCATDISQHTVTL